MSNYIHIMRAGDDYNLKLVAELDGVPIDITGYKYWFTVKSAFSNLDSEAVLQFPTVVGDNPNDVAASGVCYISIPGAITKNITAGSYFYDIQQLAGINGGISTVLPPATDYKDKLIVIPEVTQAIS